MSNGIPPETAPVSTPAGETGKPEKKKNRKTRNAAVAVEQNHQGRIASLTFSGTGADMQLAFRLKGKKNRGLTFVQASRSEAAFTVTAQLLAAAVASGAKIRVAAETGPGDTQTVTSLTLDLA